MKLSKQFETKLQLRQRILLLYWPCMRSTTTLWFLMRCFCLVTNLIPSLLSQQLVRPVPVLPRLHVRLLQHAVQVLVDPVQQVRQELRGVVLLVPLELVRDKRTIGFSFDTATFIFAGENSEFCPIQRL